MEEQYNSNDREWTGQNNYEDSTFGNIMDLHFCELIRRTSSSLAVDPATDSLPFLYLYGMHLLNRKLIREGSIWQSDDNPIE